MVEQWPTLKSGIIIWSEPIPWSRRDEDLMCNLDPNPEMDRCSISLQLTLVQVWSKVCCIIIIWLLIFNITFDLLFVFEQKDSLWMHERRTIKDPHDELDQRTRGWCGWGIHAVISMRQVNDKRIIPHGNLVLGLQVSQGVIHST